MQKLDLPESHHGEREAVWHCKRVSACLMGLPKSDCSQLKQIFNRFPRHKLQHRSTSVAPTVVPHGTEN